MSYETKHTPGPWRWEVLSKTGSTSLCGGRSGGLYVMYAQGDQILLSGELTMRPAIEFTDPSKSGQVYMSDIDHPDAHLIASAPDLLEALIELKCVADDREKELDSYNRWKSATDKAASAIEKALNYKK